MPRSVLHISLLLGSWLGNARREAQKMSAGTEQNLQITFYGYSGRYGFSAASVDVIGSSISKIEDFGYEGHILSMCLTIMSLHVTEKWIKYLTFNAKEKLS